MVLVIFSMFLMDLRRPSISRRVAKLAALGGVALDLELVLDQISFNFVFWINSGKAQVAVAAVVAGQVSG